MKEPWKETKTEGGHTRYEWWRFVVTDVPMFGDTDVWHILSGGSRIHKTDAPESAIAFAELAAEDALFHRMKGHYDGIAECHRLAQQIDLRELNPLSSR